MENKKIKVISGVNNRIGVTVPELLFNHEWPKRGASVIVESDILERLLYDNGFKYMIDTGMLYIEDMEFKKEVGLEMEDAIEPEHIYLDDKTMHRYLTVLPIGEFKSAVSKLSREQIGQLADYAIENKLTDYNKCAFIEQICGRDIIKAIKLDEASKED